MEKPRIVIIDDDFSYIIPLQSKFVYEFLDDVEIEIITSEDYVETFFQKIQKINVLIINKKFYTTSLVNHEINHIFIMTEEQDDQTTYPNVEHLIFKYTNVKGIFLEIVGISDLKIPRKNDKQKPKIVLVTSASGGAGKTTIALGIATALSDMYKRVAAVGIGEVFVKSTGKTKYRELFLEEAEKYSKVEGMADAIIAGSGENKTTKAIKTVSNVIDTIDTGANIIQDGKDMITKGEGILPKNPIPEHKVLSKESMIQKYQDSGYKHMQNLYNAFEGEANAAGVLNHAYKYAATAFDANEPGGTENAIINNFYGESKLLKDTKEILGEIDKYKN